MRTILICVLLVAVGIWPAAAQEHDESLYVAIDYARSKTDRPVSSERESWAPFWQAMVDAGYRESWTMYTVWWGFDRSYTHLWVHTAKSLSDFNVPSEIQDSLWAVAHPGKDLDSLWQANADRFDFVRSEFWRITASVGELHGEMLSVGYMDVPEGGDAEYVAVERDIWKPMKTLEVSDGLINGWVIMGKWWPGGTDYPYDYVALNARDAFESFDTSGLRLDQFERAHAGADTDALIQRTMASRSIARSELWQLRLHAHRGQ